MFKKMLSLLLSLLMVMGLFAGLAMAEETIELTYTGWGGPNERKTTQAAIDGFMKAHPNVKVKYIHIPEDYDTKLITMMAAGQEPDVALFHGDLGMTWAAEGKVFNIMEFVNEDPEMRPEDILPQAYFWWDEGKAIGFNGAIEAFGLFYNKAMFDELGVAYPPTKAAEAWTWDQFLETCQKLTLDNQGRNALDPAFDSANIKQFGLNFGTWAYMQFVYMNGGNFLTDDGTELALTEPKALEAIQRLADLMNVYHVMPNPVQQKNIPGASTALMSKKVAMVFDGQWCLQDIGLTKMDFGVGVAPKMADDITVTMTCGDPLIIFESCEHKEEAYALLKWFWNPENTMDLQTTGLWMPILKKWYTDPDLIAKWAVGNPAHPEGYVDAIMNAALENGKAMPISFVKNLPKINAILNPALDKVWLGKESAETALNGIKDTVKPEIQGFYTRPE